MDHGYFDDLTRSVGGVDTRRTVLRLLAGGALASLAARLGLAEVAEAKPKRKTRPEPKGTVQAAGKRKGKKGGKKKPKPKPQECYSDAACGACERCEGGVCLELAPLCGDPNLCTEAICNLQTNSWECRSTCQHRDAVCCQGQCYASPACSGGKQLNPETCQCECPPDQWQCADGSCVAADQCCRGEKPCGGGVCVSADQCCPQSCPPGMEQDPSTCQCRCPIDSTMCGHTFCCPAGAIFCWHDPKPHINFCQSADGAWTCPFGYSGSYPAGCYAPPAPAAVDASGDASIEGRYAAASGPGGRGGARQTRRGRARGRGRAGRKGRRGADQSVTDS